MGFQDSPSSGLPLGSSTWGTSSLSGMCRGSWLRKCDTTWDSRSHPQTWHTSNLRPDLQTGSRQYAWPVARDSLPIARVKPWDSGDSRRCWGNLQWYRVDIEFPSTLTHKPWSSTVTYDHNFYYIITSHYKNLYRTYICGSIFAGFYQIHLLKKVQLKNKYFFDSTTTCPAPPAEGTRQHRSAPPANSSMTSLPTSPSHPLECQMIPKDHAFRPS